MRISMLSLFLIIVVCNIVYSDPLVDRVFRIGGLELSPYGYGYMETQPHHSLDSTNTGFANYYARISLWIGGITSNGDTLISGADFVELEGAGKFFPQELYHDTSNVLQIANLRFATVSSYQDSTNGWNVKQFNLARQDHSFGIVLYYIKNTGKRGELNYVYAGIKYDFDVPDLNNIASSDDDILMDKTNGYTIIDFQTPKGMTVEFLSSPLIKSYWERGESPRELSDIYQQLYSSNVNIPTDTADYHFYLGSGPFTVNAGEGIILLYIIRPYSQGFSKASANITELKAGLAQFTKDKKLAVLDGEVNKKGYVDEQTPNSYSLQQNYPNPFNPITGIKYSLPEGGLVKLEIYNILGQKIKVLVNRYKEAGIHNAYWSGIDENGNTVSSGVYIYRLVTEKFQSQKKMLFIR